MLKGWYSRVATTSGVSCSGNHISTLAGYSKPRRRDTDDRGGE